MTIMSEFNAQVNESNGSGSRRGPLILQTIIDLAESIGAQNSYDGEAPHGQEMNGREAPDTFRCTDLGNGERLVARYGGDLRYCNQWKKWLTWDGTHWALDQTQTVRQWARLTIRHMYDEAKRLTELAKNEEGEEKKEKIAKRATRLLQHAVSSEKEARVNSTLHNAQMDVPVGPEQLDMDPWALNVKNGTLDLKTGTLRPHRRRDLLTKLVPIAYDSDAKCPTWERFLREIFEDNADLIWFIQKAIGYSLTGLTTEQCLFILHGGGSNGKSTFLETLRAAFVDYGKNAEFSTFLHKDVDKVRNDIAALRGARFVSAVEVDKGRRLSEAIVKALTGKDTYTARFLFQENFEFKPQMKIWLGANNKPEIKGTDDAIWRRVRLIPFNKKFENETDDKELGNKLLTELPGILHWGVFGCLAWQQEGLQPPDSVQAASKAYRVEQDLIGNFLSECCVLNKHVRTKCSVLHEAFLTWGGDKDMKQNAFGRELTARGIPTDPTSNTGLRIGVALKTHSD